MNKKILILLTPIFLFAGNASAQSMRALSNGFSIGRSTGISSNFLQISNSEANLIIDILNQNVKVTPPALIERYLIELLRSK